METTSTPSQPDNAEPATKCPVCGGSVIISMSQNVTGDKVECSTCHARFELPSGVHSAVSNEDY